MSKGTRQGPAARKPKGDTRERTEHQMLLLDVKEGWVRPGFAEDYNKQRRKRTLIKSHPDPVNCKLIAAELHQQDGRDYQVRRNKHGFGVYLRENV